jgi:hypothetical protein
VEVTGDVEHRGGLDVGVQFKSGYKLARDLVELLFSESSLGVRKVSSRKSLDFLLLRRACGIVESHVGAFILAETEVAVAECLVLEVGPADQVLITSIGDQRDLHSTCVGVIAVPELSNDQRYTKVLGVLLALQDLLLVEVHALVLLVHLWLSVHTHVWVHVAAAHMLI